jgi:hypothetical protein
MIDFYPFNICCIIYIISSIDLSQPMQKRIIPAQGSSSKATTSQDSDKDSVNLDEFSIYENPDLGI